jgi:hypothetical protein
MDMSHSVLQTLTDEKYPKFREEIINVVRRLGKNDDKWFADMDGVPFLRVVATRPAESGEPEFPYVFLNMERCREEMELGLMRAYMSSKRSHDQMEM